MCHAREDFVSPHTVARCCKAEVGAAHLRANRQGVFVQADADTGLVCNLVEGGGAATPGVRWPRASSSWEASAPRRASRTSTHRMAGLRTKLASRRIS